MRLAFTSRILSHFLFDAADECRIDSLFTFLTMGADEKEKPTPVGIANVERRTWNEQEYEEKAAQRDEEVSLD